MALCSATGPPSPHGIRNGGTSSDTSPPPPLLAAGGHCARRQNMVDAPTEVSLEGIAEEIPVGVLDDIRVKLAEDIHEAPRDGLLVGDPSVDVEIGIVHTLFRMVDVDGFGGDIEIADPDRELIQIQGALEIGAQASEPREL